MKFGLSDNQYQALHRLAIAPLKSQSAEIWIFGSRARGDQQKFSDIDILYALKPNTVLPSGFISQIVENLEESDLPVKVDLVNACDLAKSYRDSIIKERVKI